MGGGGSGRLAGLSGAAVAAGDSASDIAATAAAPTAGFTTAGVVAESPGGSSAALDSTMSAFIPLEPRL
eukprot:CAMPEP_0182552456 /NCGR_PEP_ID=MMETSP1323-20130603/48403_1 /TAXON_ID=236787 /ORGANISM="Florenciella parvula, Strain RCC1693" /LENGTH=68 /DNA_ID=CAMNT_0024764151 /DNA_START=201 /DNA_END=404 /DNA_ORIENTATION=-